MMMTLSQTKLVGLTMELDLKVREYNMLCKDLEIVKTKKIDPNDVTLLPLKDNFQKNHDEIVDINRQIRELKEKIELEKNNLKVKSEEEMFKKEKNKNDLETLKVPKVSKNSEDLEVSETLEIPENINNKESSLPILPNKRNWFLKIIEKIKNIFKH